MPRADHRFAVTVRDRYTGEQWTIHLVQQLVAGRFWVRRGGRRSAKMPEATATAVGREIGAWIGRQQRKRWFSPFFWLRLKMPRHIRGRDSNPG